MSRPKTVLVHVSARLAAALIRFRLARKSGMYGRKKAIPFLCSESGDPGGTTELEVKEQS